MYTLESTLARLKIEDRIREANQQRLAHETRRREQPSTTPTAYAVFLSHLPTGSARDTGTIASATFDALGSPSAAAKQCGFRCGVPTSHPHSRPPTSAGKW